jgi:hypothetical protein
MVFLLLGAIMILSWLRRSDWEHVQSPPRGIYLLECPTCPTASSVVDSFASDDHGVGEALQESLAEIFALSFDYGLVEGSQVLGHVVPHLVLQYISGGFLVLSGSTGLADYVGKSMKPVNRLMD